jgi:hypothetical protein
MNEETAAQHLLDSVTRRATSVAVAISTAFGEPWSLNPSTGVKAVFGLWANRSVRHLTAIVVLARIESLALLAEVHYRQILEIHLQVRYFALASALERERFAQKISAWGCVEWLRKMEPFKEHDFAKAGWREMNDQLSRYDPNIVNEVKVALSRRYYWFGRSFSGLARVVSKGAEDLEGAYHLSSTQLHGTWDLTLGASNPRPGRLDFREWPDKATLFGWAADIVDRGTQLCLRTWNEVARATGATEVK